jgi:hypothetical protein
VLEAGNGTKFWPLPLFNIVEPFLGLTRNLGARRESFKTPKSLEFDCKGQNTSYWGVLYIIRKLSKCRCRKWARLSHLDICSISYGWKKGYESNWQFGSRPLKVGIDLTPMHASGVGHTVGKLSTRSTTLHETSSQSEVWTNSYSPAKLRKSKLWQFWDCSLEVPGQKTIRVWVLRRGTKNTIWGKVVASTEFGPWWVLWVQSCPWLVLALKVL